MNKGQKEPHIQTAYEKSMQLFGSTSGWPEHVARLLVSEGDNRLGFDRENNLYFDGKKLQTVKKYSLTFWQGLFAALTSLGVLFGGLGALLDVFLA